MPAFFMGIDVGSNETKGILINEDCEIVGEHVVSHKMDNPTPGTLSTMPNVFGGVSSAPFHGNSSKAPISIPHTSPVLDYQL